MKSLVVFYSRTGTTKKVAETIAYFTKANIDEIITEKDRKGLIGFLLSGKEALFKPPAKIKETKKNPMEYDVVIIGTPVWASKLSSPVRAYLEKNKGLFKKIAFFCTKSGSSNIKTFAEMKKICTKKPKAVLELNTSQVKKDKYLKDVKDFVAKLKK